MGPRSPGRPHSAARPASEDPSLSPSGSVSLPPLRPQPAESQDGAGQRPDTASARLLDPAATYNTTLTALRLTDGQLALALALLTERSSRRHARSPGEAGGGRSDLCHDNDETDPVNRRGRIWDNLIDSTAELLAGDRCLVEFARIWLPSRNEELPADPEQGKSEFSDNGKWPKCSRRCDIERSSCRTPAIVLEALVDHSDIVEVERASSLLQPVQATSLGINHGERCRSVSECQRKSGEPGT